MNPARAAHLRNLLGAVFDRQRERLEVDCKDLRAPLDVRAVDVDLPVKAARTQQSL